MCVIGVKPQESVIFGKQNSHTHVYTSGSDLTSSHFLSLCFLSPFSYILNYLPLIRSLSVLPFFIAFYFLFSTFSSLAGSPYLFLFFPSFSSFLFYPSLFLFSFHPHNHLTSLILLMFRGSKLHTHKTYTLIRTHSGRRHYGWVVGVQPQYSIIFGQ